MKFIIVVACDLARDPNGKIIVGPETRIACDQAVKTALNSTGSFLVIATAGKAGNSWNNVVMSEVMRKYMQSLTSTLSVIGAEADEFTTWGEMKCLAETAAWCIKKGIDSVTEVTIVVKWWHAFRSRQLCHYWLKRKSLDHIPITVVKCASNASWKVIWVREPLAILKNWFRMVIGK